MRRARILLALVALLALAGCGAAKHDNAALAENNGYYVKAGDVYYQLQVSRQLNQYATEDRQYLVGLPAGTAQPNANQLWYGVFLQAFNKGHQPAQTAYRFDIKDTQANVYYPVALNSSVNPYAWAPTTMPPLSTVPAPDTTASFGPTQGALVLFKLNTTVYNNRPLTLEIHAPGTNKVSTISLDL